MESTLLNVRLKANHEPAQPRDALLEKKGGVESGASYCRTARLALPPCGMKDHGYCIVLAGDKFRPFDVARFSVSELAIGR